MAGCHEEEEMHSHGHYGMMHGMGYGMGNARMYDEMPSNRMAEKLKLYKEDLEEEIKFIDRRISELKNAKKEKKDE